jgi:hypothetical protein
MRTDIRRARALALVSLLLAAQAAAQSPWSGEPAAGYGGDLGGSGSPGLHAAGLYRLSRTRSRATGGPSFATLTVGVGLD